MKTADEIINAIYNALSKARAEARNEDHKWKNRYDALVENIQEIHNEAIKLYEDMSINDFKIGMLEAEGFYRCSTTIMSIIHNMENGNEE